MLNGKTIAVVVPAYNEERQIGLVIETMPEFVDRIVIVDDRSTDATASIVERYISEDRRPVAAIKPVHERIVANRYNRADVLKQEDLDRELERFVPSSVFNAREESDRIILIRHALNGGVGAAIARGYKWCKDFGIDCAAVMAGDGQMDPAELESICRPVVDEGVDYVKGNRLIHRSALLVMPKLRYIGNSVLSILTKLASGYWHVSDTQTGYTAISNKALCAIRLYEIYPRYGMPNDMLVKLNIAFCTLKEVEIKPVYNIGEQSKLKIWKVMPRISWLLFKSFFKRLWLKYLFRDFHPLFLLYHFAFLLALLCLPVLVRILNDINSDKGLTFQIMIAFMFLFTSSFQSLLFAMWMDIQDNERLYKT